jgi:sugar phosphate isomerase/epimerase
MTASLQKNVNQSDEGMTMTSNYYNRREFLGRAITSGTSAALAMSSLSWAADQPAGKPARLSTPNTEKLGWRICCQLYTFRDRSFYEALEVLANMGVCRVEPAFFLPLSKERQDLKTSEGLPPDQRREMKQRMNDLGISMPNYYAPIEADKSAYPKIFDFAKEMGVETLVGEPPTEMFETLDGLCQEYKINLAIHNHPEGSGSRYWNPDTLIKACDGRSPRIGACPDTGHWVRSGLNTRDSLRKYQKRIITVHLKDAAESGKRDSRDVPLGTGQANCSAILKQLYDWKWRGVMTVEYEHQSPQLVPEVAQCVSFVENFATSVKQLPARVVH